MTVIGVLWNPFFSASSSSSPHLSLSDSNEKSSAAIRDFFKMQHEHVFLSCKDRHVCGLSTSAPGKQIYLIAAPNRNSVLWLICLLPGSVPSRSAVVSKPMPSVKRNEQNGDWNAVLIPCWGSEPISCCSRCMGALQLHSGEANEFSLFVFERVCLCVFVSNSVIKCIVCVLDSLINLLYFGKDIPRLTIVCIHEKGIMLHNAKWLSARRRKRRKNKQKIDLSYQSKGVERGGDTFTINGSIYVALLQLLPLRTVKIKQTLYLIV